MSKVALSIRETKKGSIIQLSKKIIENGKVKYKRLSTGVQATERNIIYFEYNADEEFNKLLKKKNEKPYTLRELIKDIDSLLIADCNHRTAHTKHQQIRDYILPTFGNVDVKRISSFDIEKWQNNLIENKTSDMAIRCKEILSAILDKATMKGIILTNPCNGTKRIKIKPSEKKKREIYSKAEIRSMLDNSDGWFKVFIAMFAFTGIRTNEIIVLKWSDIDWNNKTMKILRAVSGGKLKVNGVENTPKTGIRTVSLQSELYNLLQELHKTAQSKWIFPNKKNTYYRNCATIRDTKFISLLKQLNIPNRTLYSLRHSYATHALLSGANLLFIARQLGHSNPSITLKFYTKYINQYKELDNECLIY